MAQQNEPSLKTALDAAANLIKQGNISGGKEGLEWVLERDPENALAWLWMSRCVKGRDAKLKCFYRVLAFDPQNKHAIKGISAVGGGEGKPSPTASPISQASTQSPPPSHQPSQKKSSRKKLVGIALVAPLLLCMVAVVFLSSIGGSISTGAGGGGDVEQVPISQSSRNWVVYRVKNSLGGGFQHIDAGVVSLTWENNTGGTNQRDALIGPKTCPADERACSDPFAVGYTMSTGDFAYISAQLDRESTRIGKLSCQIYLTDEAGADALVEDNRITQETTLWKAASCSGDYCICSASGMVGYD